MPWRNAASLIIVAEQLKVLLLKRTARSRFFASSHVFPGGVFDAEADAAGADWLRLLRDFGCDVGRRETFTSANRAQIFASNDSVCDPLLPELAFRVCALRETFEESGLLLARDANGNRVCHDASTEAFDLQHWQAAVKRDATQFLSLFRQLQLCPDFLSLHEWANWLTPSALRQRRRFNTAFFVCSVPAEFTVKLDKAEMDAYCWLTPTEAIRRYYTDQQFDVSPPTLYELAKLANFSQLAELQQFAEQRTKLGLELYFPVVGCTADGSAVTLHPGDCHYPSQPDLDSLEQLQLPRESMEALAADTPANRIGFGVIGSANSPVAKCSIDCTGLRPKFGFQAPVAMQSLLQPAKL